MKNDIVASLGLNNPVTMVTGFDRPNLFFRVVTRKGGSQKDNSIINYEYYYQEAGRAGRDGEEAECVLFFSKQDIMINKRLLQYKVTQW